MLLNLDKSKAMVVPKQVRNKTAAEVIENEIKQAVTVRGVEVPFVNEYKYLGVWIQQDLAGSCTLRTTCPRLRPSMP